MSRPSCPTCNKPIDPTHAPVARIRGAKIVTFCSASCAEGKPAPVKEPSEAPAAASTAKATKEPSAAAPPVPIAKPEPVREKPEPAREKPEPAVAKSSTRAEPVVAQELGEVSLAPASRRKTLIAVCALVVCGGGGLAAYDALRSSSTTDAPSQADTAPSAANSSVTAPTGNSNAAASAEAPATEHGATPEVLYRRAVALLKDLRKSPSRRIERLSTMALARAKDPEALDGLRALLEDEESSLNRIALAYALARSGDKSGRETLVAGLEHQRRDVRSDAAIALLNLGDDAGRSTLSRMTNLRHYKISACGHLARAGDEKAKVLLEKVYRDPNTDSETKLRAAVALGRAGDKSVAKFLRTTLDDGRFQVGAADALAALGDTSAVKPLTGQLELNAMRVRAALALRRLGAEAPLEGLAVALTEDDEVTLVTAAEAILILTGPKELASRD